MFILKSQNRGYLGTLLLAVYHEHRGLTVFLFVELAQLRRGCVVASRASVLLLFSPILLRRSSAAWLFGGLRMPRDSSKCVRRSRLH